MAQLLINGPELGTLEKFNVHMEAAKTALLNLGVKRPKLEPELAKVLELLTSATTEAHTNAGPVAAGFEILTPEDYANIYAEGITVQAVAYAMDKGYIDFVRVAESSRNRYVVMTPKTQEYAPNTNTGRPKKGANKKLPPTRDSETGAEPTAPPFTGGKAIMST